VTRPERKPITFDIRYAALRKSNGFCPYCDTPLAPVWEDGAPHAIDHIVPLRLGGADEISNLIGVCRECNGKKGAKTEFQFVAETLGIKVLPWAVALPHECGLSYDGAGWFVDLQAFEDCDVADFCEGYDEPIDDDDPEEVDPYEFFYGPDWNADEDDEEEPEEARA
jgi:hypothetical protein